MSHAILLPQKAYLPHATVTGEARWDLDATPKHLELRLFWGTRGRGSEEIHIIATLDLGAEPSGTSPFSFDLPGSPWSVDGRLITIYWALELVEKKRGGLALEEIVVSPNPSGEPAVLGLVEKPLSGVKSGNNWAPVKGR